MSSWKDSVKEQALSLGDGQTMEGECPKCGRTDSFYITRKDGLLMYIDHSVNCNFKGAVGSNPGDVVKTTQPAMKVFDGRLEELIEPEYDFFYEKFGLMDGDIRHLRWSTDDDRVYFPQHNKVGMIAGYIARHYPELANNRRVGAKALWKNVRSLVMELYFPTLGILQQVRDENIVVLVEDYISALKLHQVTRLPVCALGGTSMYEGHIRTLLDLDVKQIAIVLDADATVKAVKLRREMALAFPQSIVVPLTGPDPKDMTRQQLNELKDKLCEFF